MAMVLVTPSAPRLPEKTDWDVVESRDFWHHDIINSYQLKKDAVKEARKHSRKLSRELPEDVTLQIKNKDMEVSKSTRYRNGESV